MHDGIADAVHNGFIHFSVLTDDGQAHILFKLLLHIPDDPVHFLEYAGYRHHAQGHDNILKVIGQFAELSRSF